jgi:Ca2+-binding RTX toxin-like protein
MTATGFENLSGTIYDDSLTGDDGANTLAGDTGNDALSGGKGDDVLYGDGRIGVDTHGTGGSGPITTWGDITTIDSTLTAGNDTLDGGKGDDWLYGGGGDDVMTGAQGSDTFVIEANSGNDVITDFSKSQDTIHFDVAGVGGFGDLTLSASGAHDTLITWGTSDSVLLQGVKPNQLSSSNFDFGAASIAATFADFLPLGHGHGLGHVASHGDFGVIE